MSSKDTIQSKSNSYLNQSKKPFFFDTKLYIAINPTQMSRISLHNDNLIGTAQPLILRSVTTVPGHSHQNSDFIKLQEQNQILKTENEKLLDENKNLRDEILNIKREKSKLVLKLNQANTKAYYSKQTDEAVMRLTKELEEAHNTINSKFWYMTSLKETNISMQRSFKIIEADYASKYNMFETKVQMISMNYKKIKDKLIEVCDKYRSLSLLVSNGKRKDPWDRI